MTDLQITGKRTISDEEALNQIGVFLGSQEQWNGGDVCELVAEILEATGRPPVGDQSPKDLKMYRALAGQLGYQHDGDPDEDEED